VSGSANAIEGGAGLLRAFSGVDTPPELRLGQEWGVRMVSFKPYPICALNQTPVAMVIELMSQESIVAGDIARVTVDLSPGAARYPGIDQHGPFTEVGSTLMSLPYCLSVAALVGTVRHRDLTRFADPDIAALSRRVTVVGRDELERGACRVSVTTHSGETVTRLSRSPLDLLAWTFEECVDRVGQLAEEESVAVGRMNRLVETVQSLEKRDVRELVDATLA
jgi:2-methylcitrate dehydratase PrpD